MNRKLIMTLAVSGALAAFAGGVFANEAAKPVVGKTELQQIVTRVELALPLFIAEGDDEKKPESSQLIAEGEDEKKPESSQLIAEGDDEKKPESSQLIAEGDDEKKPESSQLIAEGDDEKKPESSQLI